MIGRRQHIARFQSDFYRDHYRKLLVGLMISMLIIFLELFGIAYLILFAPDRPYYASTTTGLIIPMTLIHRTS